MHIAFLIQFHFLIDFYHLIFILQGIQKLSNGKFVFIRNWS